VIRLFKPLWFSYLSFSLNMSDQSRPHYSNISEAPFEAEYVDLKGLPASHMRPLFQSMHAMELMALAYVEVSFEEWRAIQGNWGHSFIWFRVVSKIVSRYTSAEEVLNKVHQYLLHRFLSNHGYGEEQLTSFTDKQIKKTVAHVCIKIAAQFCEA